LVNMIKYQKQQKVYKMKHIYYIFIVFSIIITGCAQKPIDMDIIDIKKDIIVDNNPKLKRRVAILKFENKSKYGKSEVFDLDSNYKADKQAYDILYAKLAQSNKFVLFEATSLEDGNIDISTIPADYVIIGSISEFGKRETTQNEILVEKNIQEVYAKVAIRVVDVKSKEIIFATEGNGSAKVTAKSSKLMKLIEVSLDTEIDDDTILNDRAISSAISSVVDNIISKMSDKPWRSYILSNKDDHIIIAGATHQGLSIGDRFGIYKKSQKVLNPQTGLHIELPSKKVATIEVVSQFGTNYNDEGSICKLIDSNINNHNIKDLYVQK
jgi:curli biogenesis system outer membrane secretion channel CsgG